MDREGFRNRLKQYKEARGQNPQLKYWEWKETPKYEEGTGNIEEWDPRITAEGYDDKGYYAQAMNPLPEVTVVSSKTRSRSERPIQYSYVNGYPEATTWTTDYNPGAGALEIVSPEFELLSGGIGLPRQLYNNRIASLAKELISNESEKTLSKVSSKIKSHIPNTSFIGETFNVPLSKTRQLVEMYKRNISKETQDVLNLLGKERTQSNFKLRLNPSERDFLRKHNVDESVLTDRDIRKLKELRQQSISEALEKGQRVVTSPIKAEGGSLVLQKNTENGLSVIGQVNYGSNPYDYMQYLGRELRPINNMDLTDDMVIGWIQGALGEKGVSKDLYNGLAHWLNQTSPGSGFISGMKLMSPEPTTKTLDKLNKILISNQGEYQWATGITTDNPIYKIINPTGEYPAVKSLMFDPKTIKNGKIITDLDNPDIYFADGGEVGDNTDYRQQIINRADYVASNYDNAKDFDLNPLVYTFRKFAKDNFDRGGISNCTLSATGWIDPNNQYMSAKNIFNNPSSGYTEIGAGYALPGDLLITKNPKKNSYHTMLIEGFNGNEPILRYSRGGHDTKENLVIGRPLTEYHELDNKQGGNHTEDHYFRYNIPNEYWLPELIVTPNKR